MMLFFRMILGSLFLAQPVLMWSLETGFQDINIMLMVPFPDTKLTWFAEAIPSNQAIHVVLSIAVSSSWIINQ